MEQNQTTFNSLFVKHRWKYSYEIEIWNKHIIYIYQKLMWIWLKNEDFLDFDGIVHL